MNIIPQVSIDFMSQPIIMIGIILGTLAIPIFYFIQLLSVNSDKKVAKRKGKEK